MKDGDGITPQRVTAKTLAAANGWTEARAQYVLEGLLERGMVVCDGDGYRINGRGLAMGEKMGVVVEFDNTSGYKLNGG